MVGAVAFAAVASEAKAVASGTTTVLLGVMKSSRGLRHNCNLAAREGLVQFLLLLFRANLLSLAATHPARSVASVGSQSGARGRLS